MTPSTAEMAAFLKERAAEVDPMALPFGLNERRAEGIAREFARADSLGARLNLRFAYAAELLKLHPPHITDQPIIAQMKRIGIEPGKSFDFDKLDPAVKKALHVPVTPVLQRRG